VVQCQAWLVLLLPVVARGDFMLSNTIVLMSQDESIGRDVRDALGASAGANRFLIISDAQKSLEAISSEKGVGLLLVDWDSFLPKEISNFLQKFRKIRRAKPVPFMFIAGAPTSSTVAMSMEYDALQILMRQGFKAHFKHALSDFITRGSEADYFQSLLDDLEASIKSKNQKAVDEAVSLLYKKFPKNPRAIVEHGNNLLRLASFAEAIEVGNQLLELDPTNIRALTLLARAKLHTGLFEEALSLMEKSETLSPENVDRLVLFGEIHWSKGQHAEARQKYEAALGVDSGCVEAQKGLALVAASVGDEAQALSVLANSLSNDEVAGFFNSAGILASHRGRFDEAVKLYETAVKELETPEQKAKVHYNKGLAHERAGRPEEAAAAFAEAQKLNPEFEKAHSKLKESN
jgi:tetratricopeptide (TPR) repeat protein